MSDEESDLGKYPSTTQAKKISKGIIEMERESSENLFPEIDTSEVEDAIDTIEKYEHKTIVRAPEYKTALETLGEEVPLNRFDRFDQPRMAPSEYMELLEKNSEAYDDSLSQKVEMESSQIPHCQELSSIASLGETEIEFSPMAFRDYVFSGAIDEDTVYFASGLEREDIEDIADDVDGEQFKLGETKIILSGECDGRKVFVDGAPSVYRMPETSDLYSLSSSK
jgi:hypothetical protein